MGNEIASPSARNDSHCEERSDAAIRIKIEFPVRHHLLNQQHE